MYELPKTAIGEPSFNSQAYFEGANSSPGVDQTSALGQRNTINNSPEEWEEIPTDE